MRVALYSLAGWLVAVALFTVACSDTPPIAEQTAIATRQSNEANPTSTRTPHPDTWIVLAIWNEPARDVDLTLDPDGQTFVVYINEWGSTTTSDISAPPFFQMRPTIEYAACIRQVVVRQPLPECARPSTVLR